MSLTFVARPQQATLIKAPEKNIQKLEEFSVNQLENWQHLDIENDTIPGISLNRAYKTLLKNRKAQEVIVAVMDTKLDYTHEDVFSNIWVNENEIPNNAIDDDQNGYIDDIRGWNFLGNDKGEDILFQHTEALRIVKRYETQFKNKNKEDISAPVLQKQYNLYHKAKAIYKEDYNELYESIRIADSLNAIYFKGRDTLSFYFKKHPYDVTDLDSLVKIRPFLKQYTSLVKIVLNGIVTEEDIKDQQEYFTQQKEFVLNKNYKERTILSDDPLDVNDRNYGNNNVDGEVPFQHAISVAGVLGALRNNDIGIKGISDHIKIMPVVMVATGDQNDKDIANAIYYAVDNGAQIINMSWGKYLSIDNHWVRDAFIYAQKKDVLLVTAAGNDSQNIDIKDYYPLDYNSDQTEFANNLIVVGASTSSLNGNLKASFSNYGKRNVDIFAPGADVYTTTVDHAYKFSDGTSYASPIVAGVAALIRSYYPSLTAPEVKQILMDSSVKYDILVDVPTEENPEQQLLFSELSKSGGIVNAYNALLMAEQMAKN